MVLMMTTNEFVMCLYIIGGVFTGLMILIGLIAYLCGGKNETHD